MKKAILFLTALIFALGTGCSKKTADTAVSEPIPESTAEVSQEPTEYVPAELPYREYFPEDFKEISVNFLKQKNDPPVTIEETYFFMDPYGEKYSACKEDYVVDTSLEIPERYKEMFEENPSMKEDYISGREYTIAQETYAKENPSIGKIDGGGNLCGDSFYFMVNYDDLCSSSHCFDICEYNVKTDEQRLLFSYNDKDVAYRIYCMKYVKGSLYVLGERRTYFESGSEDIFGETYENSIYIGNDFYVRGDREGSYEKSEKRLFRVNTEENTLEEMWTDFLGNELISYDMFCQKYPDRLVIHGNDALYRAKQEYENASEEDLYAEAQDVEFYIYEFDFEKDEWTELYRDKTCPFYYGEELTFISDEDKKLVCGIPDKFKLNTGLRSATLLSAKDNIVTVLVEDSINSLLYIYDLEKCERYKYDLSGYPGVISVIPIDGMLLLQFGLGGGTKLLLPDIGAAFDLKIPYEYVYPEDGEIRYFCLECADPMADTANVDNQRVIVGRIFTE